MGFISKLIKAILPSKKTILINDNMSNMIREQPFTEDECTENVLLNRLDTDYSIPLKELEYIKMAILIDYLHNRNAKESLSSYIQGLVGGNIVSKISSAYENGYLRDSNLKESLEFLTVPALKNILREANKKLSGKKSDLVIRICTEIPSSFYESKLSPYYKLTEKGQNLVKSHYAYILNIRSNLSILQQEIYRYSKQLNCPTTESEAPKLFSFIIFEHIKRNSEIKNWGSLTFDYIRLSQNFRDLGMDDKSLNFLLIALSIMLSGMDDGNVVRSYDRVRIYSGYVETLGTLIIYLGITHYDLMRRIDEFVTPILNNLPFSYFDIEGIKIIIADSLEGKWADTISNFSQYDVLKKHPNKLSSRYHYYGE